MIWTMENIMKVTHRGFNVRVGIWKLGQVVRDVARVRLLLACLQSPRYGGGSARLG